MQAPPGKSALPVNHADPPCCLPPSPTGGLGDVMGALPKALAARGHRVMVVAPRYANYDDAWETGVRCTFSVFNATQEVGG